MVVLPLPVPPDTIMLTLALTQASRNSAISRLIVPRSIRSSTVKGSAANLRIVIVGPLRDNGGMMAFTLDPSGKRASTEGELSSILLPRGVMILFIACNT